MKPSLTVVMPAYAETGLPLFVAEIESAVRAWCDRVHFVVIDDCSPLLLAELPGLREAGRNLTVFRNQTNLGHGPSVVQAYLRGLETGADLIIHVDGDGQFPGIAFPGIIRGLQTAHVVHGERSSRSDPWFRRLVSRVAAGCVHGVSAPVRDANTPLRGYRREALRDLLADVDPASTVPHLVLSMIERHHGVDVGRVAVGHRDRLGASSTGTMWPAHRWSHLVPSRKLVRFSLRAALEVRRVRKDLTHVAGRATSDSRERLAVSA